MILKIPNALESSYHGLRMTAEEYFALPEDSTFRYELIDGVVCMSPSATPLHQYVAFLISMELGKYLETHDVGVALYEVDVGLAEQPDQHDIVYRPDIVFFRKERLPEVPDRLTLPPDLVVEVLSKGTMLLDLRTKKSDYERFGVSEYWLVDPVGKTMTFYRLSGSGYVEVAPMDDTFASHVVPGFVLNLGRIRAAFEGRLIP